jgi:hypothetical protein
MSTLGLYKLLKIVHLYFGMEAAIGICVRSKDLHKNTEVNMLNEQQIQKNWPQVKTQVLSKWNKLSEADIESTKGNADSLNKLVNSKYGNVPDFDKAYEAMYSSLNKSAVPSKNDIENRSAIAPSAEAGLHTNSTEDFSHEAGDELSAYSPDAPRSTSVEEEDAEFIKLDNNESNTQFTAPDEFYPSQDPSPSREDITLGRNTSSATTQSTAQAASISSEVASNDAKKKI